MSTDTLAAGALRWMNRHAGYLDTPAARAQLPATPRAKALLQLALLCRCWAKAAPGDPRRAGLTALVERVWLRPELPEIFSADRRWARQHLLMYAALAPPAAAGRAAEVLADLVAQGYLDPRRKSPYLRLETRYHAELAGAEHGFESYQELYEASLLAQEAPVLPSAKLDACNVTHTVFYLTDFGFRDCGLPAEDRAEALGVVCRLTDHCVRRGAWELVAKLVLAQYCLGADPARTSSGAAGLELLAAVQRPDGAIPGRSADEAAEEAATPVEFFRKAYQATLVTALAALVIAPGRPGPHAAAARGARRAAGA